MTVMNVRVKRALIAVPAAVALFFAAICTST